MVFVIADNNSDRLRKLSKYICKIYPGCIIYEFTDPMLAAKHICNNHVDVVLAEEKMRPVDGMALRRVLNTHKPDLHVILLSENLEVVCSGGECEWRKEQPHSAVLPAIFSIQ